MQTIDDLNGDELFAYLKANKKSLIAQKKAELKFSEPVTHRADIKKVSSKQSETSKKSDSTDGSEDETGIVNVKVVCNTAWFIDSHRDVIIDTAYDNSIKQKGISIPHLHDHEYSCTAHIGDVKKVYKQQIQLKELGLMQSGSATALVMETAVREDFNDEIFKFYSIGKINQHSIGFRCLDIRMAINSEYVGDKEEKAAWDEFYPRIINKEKADERGYFWVIADMDLLENSCVLFGANPLTPTLITETTKALNKEDDSMNDEQIKLLSATFATAVKEAVSPLADQVKALADKEPAKPDFSGLEGAVKTAFIEAVKPMVEKSEAATTALNTASESMKALADKVVSMPSPHNKSGAGVYGVAGGNKPEDETFAI